MVQYYQMYNWSVDEKAFKKADPEGYRIWRIEQTINYGTAGEKLDEKEVRKYWSKVKERIDPSYRVYLEFLLWPKRKKKASSARSKKRSWN